MLMAKDYSIQEIAHLLNLALGTARSYPKTIYSKTGVSDQAVLMAF